MEETYKLQANEVWAKSWEDCVARAERGEKIVFTPEAMLHLEKGIATLKTTINQVAKEKEGAWENRNYFCEWVNKIAQLFWGDDKQCYSPEATFRMVKEKLDKLAEVEDKFEMHLTVVRGFLAEMYATMIDPLDDTPHKVEEVCRLLLQRAREDRETARERDDLKVRVQNLEWRPITEEDMPKVGDEVYSPPHPTCFYPDDPGMVYNPCREADLRPYKGWINAPSHAFKYFRPLNAPKEKTDAVPTNLG